MWLNKWNHNIEPSFHRLSLVFLLLQTSTNLMTNGVQANPDAKRLYDDLLSHYNRLIRPVSNNSQVVTVRLGLHLTQLIDLVLYFFFKCNSQPLSVTCCTVIGFFS